MNNDDKIRFAVPIDLEKGTNAKGDKVIKVSGLASTEGYDKSGEKLHTQKFDLSEFRQINWNHKGKDSADAVLGEVEKHSWETRGGKTGLWMDGELYPEMPMVKSVMALNSALKRKGKTLQLSIEGQVVQRGSNDKKNPLYNQILKAKLTGVAITPNAVNQDTFCDLLEKGYTDNEWLFDSETESIVKSVDEDLAKAMVAGSTTGTETTNKTSTGEGLKKEDMEGVKNKCTHPDNETCENCKDKKVLSKSSQMDFIFNYFCPDNLDQVKQIQNLAQKISIMEGTNKISESTLKKAFEIIELASQQEVTEKSVDSALDLIKSDFSDLEKSEMIEELIKSDFSKEVAEEASEKFKKGKKSPKKSDVDGEDGDEKNELKKSFDTLSMRTEEFQNNSDLKLGAIGVILKAQSEMIDTLTKSNEALVETLNSVKETTDKISKTPILKTPIGSKTVERFEKSEDGTTVYDVRNKVQRKALADKLDDLSGFGRKEMNNGKYDEALYKASMEVEMIGAFSNPNVTRFLEENHKIVVKG